MRATIFAETMNQTAVRWRVIAVCFLAQNLTMAMAFGTFGPMLASTQAHFGLSRAAAATGMSCILLTMGLFSPLFGALLQRVSVRSAMLAGALLSAVGYWSLAYTRSFALALVLYGLIGMGVSLLAILGPLVLINRWFAANRGKLLSCVNLPLGMFVMPYLVAVVLPQYGRTAVLSGIGSSFLLLGPILLLLAERPRQMPAANDAPSHGADLEATLGTANILTNPAFWLVSLGIAVIAASGTAFVVHIVSFGMDKHMSLRSASALLSVYSGCGILGTLLLGWLADRIGSPATLMLASAALAVLWCAVLLVNTFTLYGVVALLGVFGVPLVTMHGAALSEMFTPAAVSRAMGVSFSIKLPFLFSFAPVAGLLYERSGSYELPFLIIASMLGASAVCFYGILFLRRRQQRTTPLASCTPGMVPRNLSGSHVSNSD